MNSQIKVIIEHPKFSLDCETEEEPSSRYFGKAILIDGNSEGNLGLFQFSSGHLQVSSNTLGLSIIGHGKPMSGTLSPFELEETSPKEEKGIDNPTSRYFGKTLVKLISLEDWKFSC